MERLDELKLKYSSVLNLIQQKGLRLHNVHVQDNKLLIKASAGSEQIKNDIWNQIKLVDASFSDLTCDINIDPSLAPAVAAVRTYTVKAGDSLSKIAKEFYGNPGAYMKIFEANKDKLKNPDLIHPGQELVIPQ